MRNGLTDSGQQVRRELTGSCRGSSAEANEAWQQAWAPGDFQQEPRQVYAAGVIDKWCKIKWQGFVHRIAEHSDGRKRDAVIGSDPGDSPAFHIGGDRVVAAAG